MDKFKRLFNKWYEKILLAVLYLSVAVYSVAALLFGIKWLLSVLGVI